MFVRVHTYIPIKYVSEGAHSHTYVHMYINTYVHTYAPVYVHTYMHLIDAVSEQGVRFMHTDIHIWHLLCWYAARMLLAARSACDLPMCAVCT